MEVLKLANIKSAKKRILVNETKAERNTSIRSAIKTYTKKVEANDKEAAASALKVASTEIDRACSKGVFHKNNAARKISRLTNLVNAMN